MRKFVPMFAVLFFVSTLNASDITQVVFTNGASYKGSIPAKYQPMVKSITNVHPKATFAVSEGKLLVGISVEGKAGEVLSIAWQSDCPVNSQYQFKGNNQLAKAIKPVLVAWTRIRHKGFEVSTLKDYRQSESWAEVVLNEPGKRVSRR